MPGRARVQLCSRSFRCSFAPGPPVGRITREMVRIPGLAQRRLLSFSILVHQKLPATC